MIKMRKSFSVLLSLALSIVLIGALCWPKAVGAIDYLVMTSAQFQTALDIVGNNGEDDTIILAEGTYIGNFDYYPEDGRTLIIRGEAGTTAQNVILDGNGGGEIVFSIGDSNASGTVNIEGITIQGGGSAGGLYIQCEDGAIDVVMERVLIQNNMIKV